jgi:cytochrome c556
MKSTTFGARVVLALAALGFAVTAGSAADTATVIKERAALMKRQGADMGAVHAFLDGKAPKAKAVAAASDLSQTALKIPSLFPADSGGTSPDGKFATKPDIWSDWQGFLAAQGAVVAKADALAAALRSNDKKQIAAAFGDLGKNGCGGCHTKFREQLQK